MGVEKEGRMERERGRGRKKEGGNRVREITKWACHPYKDLKQWRSLWWGHKWFMICLILPIPGFIHTLREAPSFSWGFTVTHHCPQGCSVCALFEIPKSICICFPLPLEGQHVLLSRILLHLEFRIKNQDDSDALMRFSPSIYSKRWSVCFWKLPLIHRAKVFSNLMVLFPVKTASSWLECTVCKGKANQY